MRAVTALYFRFTMPQSDRFSHGPRGLWPVRIFRLGEEPGDDLSAVTTAEERLAMVGELSRRMWELTGRPVPSYPRAALASLAASGARFLVIGAHAMAVHGVPRGTQDLDIWLDPSPENAERVWRGLAAFGAPLEELGIQPDDLRRSGTVIQLGLPPNRIDLLTAISGVPDFERAWAERVEHEFGGRRVPFIGRAMLINNKRESGRRKDLADLEALGELPRS